VTVTRGRSDAQMTYVKSILTTLVVALLAQPAAALARGATVLVPPGDSAASQYVETVPTDRGGGIPGSATQPNALTPAQRHHLDALGPDGAKLVAVVQATSSPPALQPSRPTAGPTGGRGNVRGGSVGPGTAGRSDGDGRGRPAGALSAADAPSTASLVLTAATGGGSGGLGIVLPLLLVVSALGVTVHAVLRRRARES
jgi:hypothetical protein